ncbi:hypothetical protein [Massilia psychrophila]|uniref:Uncharacterized protein n=1 Tax=Massilia psychrophila TaxID=1603353 RepID=A0A2G8SZR0_9BURK|nr:hypothetical protein [Massilia psychrophila]PIL39212.1 hypothetical protein CR103_14085 [Massilia psychrophila]GGE81994.1 hypothetical protein GCM10008020_28640 [Massilia psychrophila]
MNSVPTLTEADATLLDSSGWNEREENALKGATEGQFEAAIRTLRGEPLRDFIIKNWSFMGKTKITKSILAERWARSLELAELFATRSQELG